HRPGGEAARVTDPQLVRYLDSVLLREARRCVDRARRARRTLSSTREGGASFSAIAAATGALEYYLSEVLAHWEDKQLLRPDERARIRKTDELWRKYNAAAKVYGTGLDRHPIYQPFRALVTLRNVIVHRNAE